MGAGRFLDGRRLTLIRVIALGGTYATTRRFSMLSHLRVRGGHADGMRRRRNEPNRAHDQPDLVAGGGHARGSPILAVSVGDADRSHRSTHRGATRKPVGRRADAGAGDGRRGRHRYRDERKRVHDPATDRPRDAGRRYQRCGRSQLYGIRLAGFCPRRHDEHGDVLRVGTTSCIRRSASSFQFELFDPATLTGASVFGSIANLQGGTAGSGTFAFNPLSGIPISEPAELQPQSNRMRFQIADLAYPVKL